MNNKEARQYARQIIEFLNYPIDQHMLMFDFEKDVVVGALSKYADTNNEEVAKLISKINNSNYPTIEEGEKPLIKLVLRRLISCKR